MDADTEDRIRERAYALWEAEGRPHGRDQAHWLQAMHDIAQQDSVNQATPVVAAPALRSRPVAKKPAAGTAESAGSAAKPARSRRREPGMALAGPDH